MIVFFDARKPDTMGVFDVNFWFVFNVLKYEPCHEKTKSQISCAVTALHG